MPKKTDQTTLNFETAFADLTQIVEQIEHGELSLEEALEKFERGIHLIRTCQSTLKAADQKVQILMEQNGQANLMPFSAGNNDSDNS